MAARHVDDYVHLKSGEYRRRRRNTRDKWIASRRDQVYVNPVTERLDYGD